LRTNEGLRQAQRARNLPEEAADRVHDAIYDVVVDPAQRGGERQTAACKRRVLNGVQRQVMSTRRQHGAVALTHTHRSPMIQPPSR
jgi:hypothetical protein